MLFYRVGDKNKEAITYVTETKYNGETGLPISQNTRLDGLLQSPPDGSPSEVLFDEKGRPYELIWHDQDLVHREAAPAYITLKPENGVHISEFFFKAGKHIPREEGPYWIARDGETGEVRKRIFKGDDAFPELKKTTRFEP